MDKDKPKLLEVVGELLEGLRDFGVPDPPVFDFELPEKAALEDRLLTMREVCQKLSVSEATLNEWIATGVFLPPIKIAGGRQRYWKASDVNRWIAVLPEKG